jgi:hypothetical protein
MYSLDVMWCKIGSCTPCCTPSLLSPHIHSHTHTHRSDVRFVAMDNSYQLDITIQEALSRHRSDRPNNPICFVDDTMQSVGAQLINTGRNLLLIVDREQGKLRGVISKLCVCVRVCGNLGV